MPNSLRDWRTHLLAGEVGEELLGVLGWLSLGLLISGIWLWWPGPHGTSCARACARHPAARATLA